MVRLYSLGMRELKKCIPSFTVLPLKLSPGKSMKPLRQKKKTFAPSAHSVEELSEAIAQYHHRILSLEAELREHGRLGELSPRAFTKRVQELKSLHAMLRELHQYTLAEQHDQSVGLELGLPPLVSGSPDEQQYCCEYLDTRIKRTSSLLKYLMEAGEWLSAATQGQAGLLSMILRLSKLRSMVAKVHKEIDTLTHDSLQQQNVVTSLVKTLGKSNNGNELNTLVGIFDDVEGIISRVAKLRAGVKKESLRTKAMQNWLNQEESKLHARRPDMTPISPMALGKVAATLQRPMRKRDSLTRQYWDEVVSDPTPYVKKDSLTSAATLIAGRLTLPRGHTDREAG